MKKRSLTFLFFIAFLFARSQESNYRSHFYFAWGYNKELYSPSTIHISQPGLGNDFDLREITGNDRIGWDKLFVHQLTIPQYNYRIGFFSRKNPSIGFELNF